jgi:hypothetical protein
MCEKGENEAMRKYQQEGILNILATIKKGQKAALYDDCQRGVLICIDYIDDVVGHGTKTVELLKDYDDLLKKAKTGRVYKDLLIKRLRYIEKSVKEELQPKDKPDIVFLSYKAAMSDSIESIYLAAKNDPDVNVFFIPIPYYNKDAPTEIIYEGAEYYGDNIECTHYNEYNIKTRYPDVIFTFNPYDNGNHITSIHPDYYCEVIHNYTGFLVYVPYGTEGKDIVTREWVCFTAGSLYADKVFVESDFVRDFFIERHEKAHEDNFGNAKDKFIALGSPKYDKVINTKREDYVLPDEWKKLIGDKKIVLYNITVASAFSGQVTTEQFLKKVRSVFDAFKKSDDFLLWFCPHPLLKAAFKTMRPMYYDEYTELVKSFIDDDFGIYDDTPDLHRAIVWSDIRYGDESSAMRLFAVTGKPMIMQDYLLDYNPWSVLDGQSNDIVTEKEMPPIKLDDDLAYNLDGTCGEKIWEYVKKEVGL